MSNNNSAGKTIPFFTYLVSGLIALWLILPSKASAETCRVWVPISVDDISFVVPAWVEQEDNTGVCLTITSPSDGSLVNQTPFTVTGNVGDAVSTLTINGENVTPAADNSFSHAVSLTEGTNTITFELTDTAGGPATQTIDVTLDTVLPAVTVVSPLDGSVTNQPTQLFSGTVSEMTTLKLNGVDVPVNQDNTFSAGPTALAEGPNNFTFEATDTAGNIGQTSITVTRDTTAPIITVTSPANNAVVNNANLTISGSVNESVNQLTIDGAGVTVEADLSFSHSITLTGGPNNISFNATDLVGNIGTLSLSVTLNRAPQITSSPVTSAKVNVGYSYDVDATDEDGHTLSYQLSQSPTGMTINAATGVITWTPLTTGTETVEVIVNDGFIDSAPQQYTIITTVNQLPTITSLPSTTASSGQSYSYQVLANDPDDSTFVYSLLTAPVGMTINSSTGLIQWTPGSSFGTADVVIEVDDTSGATYIQSYTICE